MKHTNLKLLAVTFSMVLSCSAFATGGGGKSDPPQKATSSGSGVKIEIVIIDIKNWIKSL